MDDSAAEKLFMQDAWTILDKALQDTSVAKAAVHPMMMTWLHRCMRARRELTTSALTLTAGVFLDAGKDDEACEVRSVPPTVPKDSIPANAKDRWTLEEESTPAFSRTWAAESWTSSGVILAPAQEGALAENELKNVIRKCGVTAMTGHTVILVAEVPKRPIDEREEEKKKGHFSFEVRNEKIQCRRLKIIPTGRLP